MAATDHVPTFNLKAVLQETGLKPDTLRAWERRYGLPQPDRSAGGHRLYSQRDIEIIKWLIARQDEGLSISRAVDLWRSLDESGQDPLHMAEFASRESPVAAVKLPHGDALADLRQAWKSACLTYDERGAEQVLAQAFALYTVEVVCLELIQRGLAELGEGWYRGEVTVQQEHFASELAMRRLEALLAATPPPTRSSRILVGCPPYEEHTFSPLLVTLFLRRQGWDVLYLGANVPVARLEYALGMAQPDLVVLSSQQLHTAASLLEMALLLREQNVPLAFGGLVFNWVPALRQRIPGYFLGESLEVVPQVVGQILSTRPDLPSVQMASEVYRRALDRYRERKALIEAEMWQLMEPSDIPHDQLANANARFGLNIAAALSLGDMDLLGADIEWVVGLLGHHNMSSSLLYEYLETYHQVVQNHLGEDGAPVVDWLARILEKRPQA